MSGPLFNGMLFMGEGDGKLISTALSDVQIGYATFVDNILCTGPSSWLCPADDVRLMCASMHGN